MADIIKVSGKSNSIGSPKYTCGDVVMFDVDNETICGEIYIIDAYGCFEFSTEPCYDILAFYKGDQILFKHIKESELK